MATEKATAEKSVSRGERIDDASSGDLSVGERSVDGTSLRERFYRDDIFDVLSNERRRCTLFYLQQQPEPVELGTVVDHVTAWQYDQPVTALDADERMRVYASLHQVHLPKLDTAGFIDYDSENGTIVVNDAARYAKLYLEYDPGNDIPWSSLYVGLVAIGTALFLPSYFGIYPFDWLGGHLVASVLVGTFALASLGHVVHEWRNKRSAAELFEVEQ